MSGMFEGLLIQILLVLYYSRYSTFSSLATAVVTLKMTSILDRLPHKSTVYRQWNMSCQSLCVYCLATESWITSMTLLQGWRGSYSAKTWHTFSMPASTPFATKPNILLKQRKNRYEVYDIYIYSMYMKCITGEPQTYEGLLCVLTWTTNRIYS